MNSKLKHASKFLSLILRHDPAAAGIMLDSGGWAYVPDLLEGMKKNGTVIDNVDLLKIVEQDEKQRYSLSVDSRYIRANQGHSITVDLGLVKQTPPDTLYHGTDRIASVLIEKNGIFKMSRNHVHLSSSPLTAKVVGGRHGVPFIFKVDSKAMCVDGYEFYKSENNVWLTDFVPPKYLSEYVG